MKINLIIHKIILFISLASGCAAIDKQASKNQECTEDWYTLLESKVSTGDGHGHGPDIGSMEWRSAIEFKLGIRGDSNIPSLETDAWCHYIDENHLN